MCSPKAYDALYSSKCQVQGQSLSTLLILQVPLVSRQMLKSLISQEIFCNLTIAYTFSCAVLDFVCIIS